MLPTLPRRTFLKVAGLSSVGLAVGSSALGRIDPSRSGAAAPNQLSEDPIGALASDLDYDLDRIFRFVTDEVWYEPYAGVLRGARGTLESRAGNSADKSLLLAALLNASMFETRFALGDLGDDAATAILAATAVTEAQARERARALLEGEPGGRSQAPSPPPADLPAEVQAIVSRLPELDQAATTWTTANVDTTVATIVDTLAAAGVQVPAFTDGLPAAERERHVWVQVAFGADWMDLDPSQAGATPGATSATLSGEPVPTLPDDLRHRIDITVTLERISGAGTEQEVLIEHGAFADELAGLPIALAHEKPEGLEALGVAIGQLLTGGVRYQAMLQVGDAVIIGLSALQFSGGDPGIFGTEASDREGEALAEWLETRVTSPDGAVSTSRSTIFDRVGDEVRLAGPVDPLTIPAVALVDMDPEAPAEYPPVRTLHFLSVATGATSRQVVYGLDETGEPNAAVLGVGAPLYHLGRDTANAALALERGTRTFLDAPNIVQYSVAPTPLADGAWTITETMDLLHRSFGSLPVSDVPASVPAGVLAGVISHSVERVRAGDALPADLAPASPALSVGAILERAASEGIGLRVVQGTPPPTCAIPAGPRASGRLPGGGLDRDRARSASDLR